MARGDRPGLDYDDWRTMSARLLRRGASEREAILARSGLDNHAWTAANVYWLERLAAELVDGRGELVDGYVATCVAELEARAVDATLEATLASAAFDPAELLTPDDVERYAVLVAYTEDAAYDERARLHAHHGIADELQRTALDERMEQAMRASAPLRESFCQRLEAWRRYRRMVG